MRRAELYWLISSNVLLFSTLSPPCFILTRRRQAYYYRLTLAIKHTNLTYTHVRTCVYKYLCSTSSSTMTGFGEQWWLEDGPLCRPRGRAHHRRPYQGTLLLYCSTVSLTLCETDRSIVCMCVCLCVTSVSLCMLYVSYVCVWCT